MVKIERQKGWLTVGKIFHWTKFPSGGFRFAIGKGKRAWFLTLIVSKNYKGLEYIKLNYRGGNGIIKGKTILNKNFSH